MVKRRIFTVILAVLAGITRLCSQDVPAFPGAEGYGKNVTGGRGGRVIYVTHIRDNTDKFGRGYKGSLRAALETPGNDPITIVFKCGGVISPLGTLNCSRSNVTIAGQTALGNGICIKNYGINFSGNNIIIRHMRFRVGDAIMQNDPALTFSNGKKAIIDHCSFSWSIEENVNITDVDSVTLQWCINSESLYSSTHLKGERAYAAQWGGMHSSYHHNLLAHHNSRVPRQNGCRNNDIEVTWDYRNNVHFNWGNTGAFYGGEVDVFGGFSHSNLINNYYKPGPATTTSKSSQYFCAPSLGKYDPNVYGYG
ncbi:MAG: pectate lyase, partial [Bacteroidales bacterium]|nr:pectate lyase [Bacteroidales bacterium]